MKKIYFAFLLLWLPFCSVHAENGYDLWLRYEKIDDAKILSLYRQAITGIQFNTTTPALSVARQELFHDLQSLLDKKITALKNITDNCIVAGTPASSAIIADIFSTAKYDLNNDGFIIVSKKINQKNIIAIAATDDIGVLYGVFSFLRLLQMHQPIHPLSIISIPKIKNRILDHWDNINRTVERGYAGISLWNWHTLPDYIDKRYIDYARANASIGINGSVLTNVNANSIVLTHTYLQKVKALADVFRPYGIKVYLTAKFSAPVEIGGLPTADPLDSLVINWWRKKCDEIYQLIPDFGGFLIKANSEGQPGPQGYGRTHADGANMFADALAPHGGIVMWRAFVYDVRPQKNDEHFGEENKNDQNNNIASEDRFKQAYDEFKPLDGQFRKNVLLQVKNGPIDFQPREPFSPLFGAMTKTSLMPEFQLTQEYLGQGTHLVYEAPLFKEVLDADTYTHGKNSTVAKIISGQFDNRSLTGIAGVANIGNDINWTGHPFGQANWYAFGRLAWDYDLAAAQIADEWIRQTFSNNTTVVATIEKMMMASREAVVNYMTPLGLHHIMGTGHHYGPAPWVNNAGRPDWNPVYYHRADAYGIGFNRTVSGSNALAQYQPQVQQQWNDSNTCDEKYLLWFHHVSWQHKMKDGKLLWDELCYKYQQGVDTVRWMQQQWASLKNRIDDERFNSVRMYLNIQENEAVWWKNACILYFREFSKMPIPPGVENPDKTLEYYEQLKFPYAPGIGGNI
jgi:alpha-glucuronidase